MTDSEKKNSTPDKDTEESVDEILASILNKDGSFNDEFNGLFKKYLAGSDTDDKPVSVNVDISDRRGEETENRHVEYEAVSPEQNEGPSIDSRIEAKMPDEVRGIYAEAANEAQRPEFTATGNVKYPTMGVGDSEERVVYDAEWEEKAKQEAARLERVRQDRMLRGDSTYVRSFVTRGAHHPVYKSPFVDQPSGVNSAYIDPLSDDDDMYEPDEPYEGSRSGKKSFFPEGFSAAQENSDAAGGRTADDRRKKKSSMIPTQDEGNYSMSWMQVDDTQQKKKKHGKGKKNTHRRLPSPYADIPIPETEVKTEKQIRQKPRKVSHADMEAVTAAADETKGLRSTVAQIVDKYNRRTEEEEKLKAQQEKEKALNEKKKQKELASLRKHMSKEIVDVLDTESAVSEVYDDFSDAPPAVPDTAEEDKPEEVYIPGKKYTEQIDEAEDISGKAEVKRGKNGKHKKSNSKNRRRKI